MNMYALPIKETLNSAWTKVEGSKKTFFIAFIILFAVMFGISLVEGVFQAINSGLGSFAKIIANIVGYLLQMGFLYMGICRAKDQPLNYTLLFRAFNLMRALSIIGLYILEALIFFIPSMIIFASTFIYAIGFPGATLISVTLLALAIFAIVYIAIRLIPGIALILDKDVNPVAAVRESFRLTQGNAFNLFVITLVQIIAIAFGIITFGIGLIWMLPFSLITYGLIYRKLVENH